MPVISRFFALPAQALRRWGLLACVGLGFGLNTSAEWRRDNLKGIVEIIPGWGGMNRNLPG